MFYSQMATTGLDDFVPLDRTFHELTPRSEGADDAEVPAVLRRHGALHWHDLLREYRVVLLSEAGSGKTTEVRNVARTLRRDGKPAFFVRIEHVTHGFEDAFEEGALSEFNAWAGSGKEGWLLLDSVDEARLRDPKDFERAVKKLGRVLAPVLQHAHIVITGRTTAWRATTDLMLCRAAMPYRPPAQETNQQGGGDEPRSANEMRDVRAAVADFRLFALDDLHGSQVDAFLAAKRVEDREAFRKAVDRKDAWDLTTRPQDLAELADLWNDERRIGSRFELMQDSITRRLVERDQDRSDARPIAPEKLRQGACLVAAAATLGQQSAIAVPDGAETTKGLDIREVLSDWNDAERSALLARPIFDEAIYGAVRFHHRSVREFLAAEWLHHLILSDGSRAKIEALCFREQYGTEVVVPTMRPVLSWLCILDERILERACRVAPEIVFEGGDPSHLPRETRSRILSQVCEQLAQPRNGRSLSDYSDVQRFANVDLTDDIKRLLARHGEDDDIVWLLLHMVWQGEIAGAAAEVKACALESRAHYTRIAAFRALGVVGSATDQNEVRVALIAEAGDVDREWLAELIPQLPQVEESTSWLLAALGRTPSKTRFRTDSLVGALSTLIAAWPLALLPLFLAGLAKLVQAPPVVERLKCAISQRNGWLMQHAAEVLLRLIEERDASALDPPALAILRALPIAERYGLHDGREIAAKLSSAVGQWRALNHGLFWHSVTETRAALEAEDGKRLVDFWQVAVHGRYWSFDATAFEAVCEDIKSRNVLDDRLVALTLGFAIYRQNGRQPAWRRALKKVAGTEGELEALLANLMRPPASGRESWRQQEARWKRRAAREVEVRERNERRWKAYLSANVQRIRETGKPGVITNAQYYLHQRIGEGAGPSSKWSAANWRALVPEFGEEIAQAFRDGAVNFWRGYQPQLLSEGAESNTTPFHVIFGLTGLAIESGEEPGWPRALSEADARVATRYALRELNGFPTWLSVLHAAHPQSVIAVVAAEIAHELATESGDVNAERHDVLYDVSWAGDWMWDGLAELTIACLREPPRNLGNLRFIARIAQGSSLEDATIAGLVAPLAKATQDLARAAVLFAMWVGVEPGVAIPALAARLAEIKTEDDKTTFAMQFITALVGGRSSSRGARQAYRTVEHMKALYLLIQDHVREREDINRAHGGSYSVGLRDEAQDARNALLAFIQETPGKEAFLALMDIARAHPTESSKAWLVTRAKAKAAVDADLAPWQPRQVRDFTDELERTPASHRDLWSLAVDRLLDLKHDLEDGDGSIASILLKVDKETEIRKYIGNWCRERARGRYAVPQEEELADAKRPDLRFHGIGFDGPVPAELKLADKWTGPHLFERLATQLCGDYLRDKRSSRGIFGLVHHGEKRSWELPNGKRAENFGELVEALRGYWASLSPEFPGVEDIRVIGIDLTKRGAEGNRGRQ